MYMHLFMLSRKNHPILPLHMELSITWRLQLMDSMTVSYYGKHGPDNTLPTIKKQTARLTAMERILSTSPKNTHLVIKIPIHSKTPPSLILPNDRSGILAKIKIKIPMTETTMQQYDATKKPPLSKSFCKLDLGLRATITIALFTTERNFEYFVVNALSIKFKKMCALFSRFP